jgi:hypothetical protein
MFFLHISSTGNIMVLYKSGGVFVDYLTGKEICEKWGITPRMVNYYCSAGRIPGAVKKGNLWLVPKEAEKPEDKRYKNFSEQG